MFKNGLKVDWFVQKLKKKKISADASERKIGLGLVVKSGIKFKNYPVRTSSVNFGRIF